MATKKTKKRKAVAKPVKNTYKKSSNNYGKKSLSQWIMIYLVLGLIVYGLIYFFVFSKRGSYQYVSPKPPVKQNSGYNF